MFRLLPYAEVRWHRALIGGIVTALLIVVGSSIFGWYLSRFGTSSASGLAGAIAFFLVWVFYISQVMLAGAELTKVLGMRSDRSASPTREELA
jgi:membrane protein